MPHGWLKVELYEAYPTGLRPWGEPRPFERDYINSWLGKVWNLCWRKRPLGRPSQPGATATSARKIIDWMKNILPLSSSSDQIRLETWSGTKTCLKPLHVSHTDLYQIGAGAAGGLLLWAQAKFIILTLPKRILKVHIWDLTNGMNLNNRLN